MSDEKIKLGMDLSDFQKAESQLLAWFNKIYQDYSAFALKSVELSKKSGSLMEATFNTIKKDGQQAVVTIKNLTDAFISFDKASGKMRSSGQFVNQQNVLPIVSTVQGRIPPAPSKLPIQGNFDVEFRQMELDLINRQKRLAALRQQGYTTELRAMEVSLAAQAQKVAEMRARGFSTEIRTMELALIKQTQEATRLRAMGFEKEARQMELALIKQTDEITRLRAAGFSKEARQMELALIKQAEEAARLRTMGFSKEERQMELALIKQTNEIARLRAAGYEKEARQMELALIKQAEEAARLRVQGFSKEARTMELALIQQANEAARLRLLGFSKEARVMELALIKQQQEITRLRAAGYEKEARQMELALIKQAERAAALRAQGYEKERRVMEVALLKQQNAPTRLDKFFNQAAAIASGMVISQTLFRITTELQSAISAAQRFEIQISNIRTLSQDNQQTSATWTKEIRALSDAFGADIFDVAASTYELISNQIASGAQATEFMNKVLQFATITLSSTKDAGDLLASAINAYGFSVEQADMITATFFKHIDVGRAKVSDLANSFGTTAPIAAQLGVSFTDLNAVMAAMEIQGVRVNNASTYLRNIMQALLKPSEEFKKTLASWGTPTGQQAIALSGLVGVMEKLNAEVEKGGLQELAENLPNLRGLQGGALLSGQGIEILRKNIAEFKNSGAQAAGALKIQFESAGKQLGIEFNKMKNSFMLDFGEPVVKGLNATIKTFGGLADITKTTTAVAITATVAWTSYKAILIGTALQAALTTNAMTGMTAATVGFTRAMAFLTGPVGIIVTTISVLTYKLVTAKSTAQEYAETLAKIQETSGPIFDKIQSDMADTTNKIKDQMSENAKGLYQEVADTRLKIASELEKVNEDFERIQDNFKITFDLFLDLFADRIKSIKSEISTLDSLIKGSVSYVREFEKKREVGRFEDTIQDQPFSKRAEAESKRSDQLLEQARKAFDNALDLRTKAISLEGEARAEMLVEMANAFKDAQALYEEGLALSDRAQKTAIEGIKDYNRKVKELDKDIAKAEANIAKIENKQNKEKDIKMPKWHGGTQASFERYKERFAAAQEKVEQAKQEDAQRYKERAQLIATRKELVGQRTAMQELAKLQQIKTEESAKQLAIEKEIKEQQERMRQAAKEEKDDRERKLKDLEAAQTILKDQFKDILKFKITDKQTPEQARKAFEEFQRQTANAMMAAKTAGLNIGDELNLIKAMEEKTANLEKEVSLKEQSAQWTDVILGKEKAVVAAQKEQDEILKIRTENVKLLEKQANEVATMITLLKDKSFTRGVTMDTKTAEIFEKALPGLRSKDVQDQLKSINMIKKAIEDLGKAQQRSGGIPVFLQEISAAISRWGVVATEFEQNSAAIQEAQKALTDAMESNMQASADKQVAITKDMLDRIVMLYQAAGGTFMQTQAPTTGTEGTAETRSVNNTFGGINVTVNGGSSAPATAREIAVALRRELKRGTVRPLS